MLYSGITEQTKASVHRLDDARALLREQRWRGSMYLAGYAVECQLKAKLMQIYNTKNLFELETELQRRGTLTATATIFTHHLELLLELTQGLARLRQNSTLWPQFTMVNRWVPAWRYTSDLSNRRNAESFLEAVENVMDWIEHNT